MDGTSPSSPLRFSLVIPIYNEEDNVDALVDELKETLPALGAHEIVAVDDGSTDRTPDKLRQRMRDCPSLRVLRLAQNRGQSAALAAGFDHARAPLVLMMDGDRQNDPRDFAAILAALATHDGASGWRVKRQDTLMRRIQSRIANRIRNWVSGDRVADSASGIKGFRRDVLRRIPRFVGMHRFLPTLVRTAGGTVIEIPVNHRPRVAGKAKYGIGNRALRAFVDLLAVRWMRKRFLRYDVASDTAAASPPTAVTPPASDASAADPGRSARRSAC